MDVEKVDFHPNRLRFMYAVNIMGAGAIGLALLVAPSAMYSFLGAEVVDSMWAAVTCSVSERFAFRVCVRR